MHRWSRGVRCSRARNLGPAVVTLAFLYAACTRGSPARACWRRWARTLSPRPGPRACRTDRGRPACPAGGLTPILTIFGMDLGAAGRRDPHRDQVLGAGPRAFTCWRSRTRTSRDHGRRHARRVLHRVREHAGGLLYAVVDPKVRTADGPAGVRDLHVQVPDRRGRGQGRRRPLLQPGAGPHARHRRRVRLGQERDQPGHLGLLAGHGRRRHRPDPVRRRESARAEPAECASSAAARWR